MRPIIQKSAVGKRGHKTAPQTDYIKRAIRFGCLLTWLKTGIAETPAEWHHKREGTGLGAIAVHHEGIALSPHYHRQSNEALHVMGRKAWEVKHGYTESQLIEISKVKFDWVD